jgi:hypothetical protein
MDVIQSEILRANIYINKYVIKITAVAMIKDKGKAIPITGP